jgi:hypothetical protein
MGLTSGTRVRAVRLERAEPEPLKSSLTQPKEARS